MGKALVLVTAKGQATVRTTKLVRFDRQRSANGMLICFGIPIDGIGGGFVIFGKQGLLQT